MGMPAFLPLRNNSAILDQIELIPMAKAYPLKPIWLSVLFVEVQF